MNPNPTTQTPSKPAPKATPRPDSSPPTAANKSGARTAGASDPTKDNPTTRDDQSRAFAKINRALGKAIHDYELIKDGDKILVAVSGGKDSLTMLHFLREFQRKAPVRFELLAVNLDQGQPGFPTDTLPNLFRQWAVPFHVETQDTYSIVMEKTAPGKTYCAVCSRLRRGILYNVARQRGCNKIALGHHRDDLTTTFLMNALFSGQLGTMTPIYSIEAGDLQVIRPLFAVHEDWIKTYVAGSDWPIIPCNLCGSQEGLKRQEMARLLDELQEKFPEVKNSLFRALGNPHVEQLLDRDLWNDPGAANPRAPH